VATMANNFIALGFEARTRSKRAGIRGVWELFRLQRSLTQIDAIT